MGNKTTPEMLATVGAGKHAWSFEGKVMVGTVWRCGHNHRREQNARKCAQDHLDRLAISTTTQQAGESGEGVRGE